MSASLVRRGLELLNADLSDGHDGKKKKDPKGRKGNKSKKRSSSGPGVGHSRASAKQRRMKSALEEATRGHTDQATVNLQYFLHSDSCTSSEQSAKIVRQNVGRQSRNSTAPRVDRPKVSQSVFTEEQFQQFQKEYFGRTVEKQ